MPLKRVMLLAEELQHTTDAKTDDVPSSKNKIKNLSVDVADNPESEIANDFTDPVSLEPTQAEVDAAVREKKADEVIEKFRISKDQYGNVVMCVPIGPRKEIIHLDSQAGIDALCVELGMPSKTNMERIQILIRHKVSSADRLIRTYQRIGRDVSCAYLIDIGDKTGMVARVANGEWEIISDNLVPFKRPRGHGELPTPKRCKTAKKALAKLHTWLCRHGAPRDRALLIIAALVCYLKEGSSYPFLLLIGPAGSGKSTLMVLLLKLIDPPATNSPPDVNTTLEDITAAAQARLILPMDNVSKLNQEVQDLLCKCSTGGEVVRRVLYTTADAAFLSIHKPVIATAIHNVINKPDLASRAVLCELPLREDRKSPDEIFVEFDDEAPELFGALLELVAASTRPFEGELPIKHRLYDFCLSGQRIFHAANINPSEFMTLVDRMRSETGAEIMESDQFAVSVRKIIDEQAALSTGGEKIPGYKSWWNNGFVSVERDDGTILVACRPKQMLAKMRPIIGSSRGWLPDNPRALSSALLRITPVFADVGIKVEKKSASQDKPYWLFSWSTLTE